MFSRRPSRALKYQANICAVISLSPGGCWPSRPDQRTRVHRLHPAHQRPSRSSRRASVHPRHPDRRGVPHDTIDTAELCVSELVTNAVIPNRPAAELMARLHADVLTVSVRDSGGDSVVRAESFNDPLRVAGRGLSLVEALTTGLGDRARCRRHDGLVRAPERVGYCLTKVAPEVRLELRPHDRQQPRTGADRPCLALVRAPSE
jgi:hypothetical protein